MFRFFLVLLVFVCANQTPVGAQQDGLSALNQHVVGLYRAGKYAAATKIAQRALVVAREKFGPDHPLVGTFLNNLAALYRAQGRYAEAELLYKRDLAISEKALGRDHPNVATTLNNLAGLYESQGRYAEAEPLYKRTITIFEKALGPDHPDVGTTLNNLAFLYKSQGRYAEAEPLYKRDLAISGKALGPDHPDVAKTVNNLATLYGSQGRYAEAEPLYKRALAVKQKALGPDHPNVATTLNDLALLYHAQGRTAEAEPLYKRGLAISEKALGPDHPNVATTLNNLAGLYYAQGRYTDAEPLYKRGLGIEEQALGPDHPDVGASLNNLAELYQAQGRYAEAEPLYKRTITIIQKVLGPDHPSAGTTLNNLAALYRTQGRYAEAEPLYKRSLSIREKALGRDHPKVRITLNNLAALYESQGRTADETKLRARLARMPPAGTRHLPVYFATTRSRAVQNQSRTTETKVLFGAEPAETLSFGRVVMQVPAKVIKRLGEDRAANLRLDRGREKLTAADVFKRVRHRHLSRQTFAGSLEARLSRSALAKDQALIFVHGFNVDFDEATKRLSQVAFDLEFDGALVAFSWPSMGSQFRYLTDRARADASVDQLIAFLDQLSSDLPEVTLHVMAHSMGNRILTRALHKIALRPKDAARPKLGEIILAHADATPEWCAKLGKARAYVRGITNYANRDDAALRVSSTIRVGEDRCGLDPKAYDGIETIDTTGMGGERESLVSVMFGAKNHHGVFANDPLLFGDISRLIASGQRPAHERTPEFAQRKDAAGGTYWAFDPSRVLGAESEIVQAD